MKNVCSHRTHLLGDEAHDDVLRANLGATQRLGLLLREHDRLDGALGELFEHRGDDERAAGLRKGEGRREERGGRTIY